MTDISEKIETPLGAVRTKLAELKRALPGDMDVADLERATKQLSGFARDLFALAELERSDVPAQMAELDLSGLLSEIAEELRLLASAQGITVRTLIEQSVRICGDRKLMREAFSHLISNSVKFMRSERPREIMLSLSKKSGTAIFKIRDTGLGIRREEIESIFERFYRTERAVALKVQGHGMGLAIVQRIVKKHGGGISAQSVVGEGTIIEIDLPAL